jgi:cell division protein FtsL
MQRERLVQDEINGHLRLEIETLRSPARIERLATGRLHMVAPGPEDATVVERVRSAAPPSKSIVALR